ncbi:MAG: hypothetical protein ACREP7_15530 [Lysobacter sp.]
MNKPISTLVGLASAGILAAIGLSVLTVTSDSTSGALNFFGWVFLVALFSVPIALIVGLPLVWLLDRWGKVNAATSIISGALVGWIALMVFSWPAPQPLRVHLLDVAIGAVSGLAFWFVWAWNKA